MIFILFASFFWKFFIHSGSLSAGGHNNVPDFSIETSFAGPIGGVDEAGRGPWAGPVVAAAVVSLTLFPFPLHSPNPSTIRRSYLPLNEILFITH